MGDNTHYVVADKDDEVGFLSFHDLYKVKPFLFLMYMLYEIYDSIKTA